MDALTMEGAQARTWRSKPATQILAVVAVLGPLYAFGMWSHLAGPPLTLRQLFLYPMILGGGDVVLVLLAYRYVCGRPLRALNRSTGAWWTDALMGVALGVFLLALLGVQRWAQLRWSAGSSGPPPQELLTLFQGVAGDPVLLAVWLGPVVWIGVAGFEELARAFFLDRLWSVWPTPAARWGVLVTSGALFGLVHVYQGWLNVLAIAIQGVLYGWYYLRVGRIWPMIVGHALYDSFQVIQLVRVFGG